MQRLGGLGEPGLFRDLVAVEVLRWRGFVRRDKQGGARDSLWLLLRPGSFPGSFGGQTWGETSSGAPYVLE